MLRGGLFAAPDAVEIIPGLRIGAAPSRRTARAIARIGVTCAVDLRENFGPGLWPAAVRAISYPMVEYEAPSVASLRAIGDNVAQLVAGGEVVYVHCRAGVQRAPMVACAALMQMGSSLADAYRLIVSRRAVAGMSEEQLDVLKALDGERPLPSLRRSVGQ